MVYGAEIGRGEKMNQQFGVENTEIEGLKIIHPFVVYDDRGYFMKTYEKDFFAANGIILENYEDMLTCSKKGVIRGLHFQTIRPQDKYIMVYVGKIYDVVVDLRKGSKTFGKWKGIELSEENKLGLYIPRGFAHGFMALSEQVKFQYRCGEKYMPNADSGIRWDDPDIGVQWRTLETDPIISERDKKLMSFANFCNVYGGL